MAFSRSILILALEAVLLLTVLTQMGNQVSAQFGLSVPCNNCLVGQISALPTCVGVNLGNQTTPEYKACLCDASFDFTWTNACSTSCQANELTVFKSGFASNLLTGLNITCVKPTPSPTPTPAATTTADTSKPTSPSAAVQLSITQSAAVLGWAVALSTIMAVLSAL
ncbi:hypothetical protein BG015_006005 [Linnemannia schmuckeri]|uniref:Uncharacterized protein n=1 Tax=Linnemannia schmuckeri TaxID=64567 RepID=A0A9P5VC99_9FUNG|nr:hypothetical protein BG015_006005 [Linnemannia schmuckeri]